MAQFKRDRKISYNEQEHYTDKNNVLVQEHYQAGTKYTTNQDRTGTETKTLNRTLFPSYTTLNADSFVWIYCS